MPKPASKLPITEVSPPPELVKRTGRMFSTEYKLKILAEAEAEAERSACALQSILRKRINYRAVRAQVGAQVEAQVEEQVGMRILRACARSPLSSAEIASFSGHKTLSGNLRKALPVLREAGLLEYTIPDKPNSRLQKYRLTEKGKQALIDKN